MRVLMFGWEFPPHISGGLGTACYGLTRGLSHIPGLQVLFVVPKAYGDEDQSGIRLVGANKVPVSHRELKLKHFSETLDYIEVGSKLIPYMEPEEFWRHTREEKLRQLEFLNTNEDGFVDFSGKYGADLLREIRDYALVSNIIAQDYAFDIIHAHDWLAYPAGIAAKEASGKPLVVHVHATDFDRSGGSVNPGVYEIEKKGMEAADKVITVRNLTRNTVINNYGIDPNKIMTVYNAVEPHHEIEKYRTEKGINDKIVTFLGRITLQKGPEYFIEAAHKVLKKMDNVRFVMAGSGDMMERMIHRAARLKIMDKFHFTGFLKADEVYKMFHLSDVYVMPSVSEPFGISPLEAMQSNVPVIISHQSGVSEILKYAVKVDFWDIDAMADAIYGLLNYEALPSIFKRLGKIEVENLKWENSASHVRKIYYSLMQ
jgi:glycosyltransferase involved in cell wall biosynthesis